MRRIAVVTAALVFGCAMTWLAFRGTDWAEVWTAAGNARPLWLAATLLCLIAATAVRAHRWNIFVRATVVTTRFRHVFAAVAIDQLAQMALPLKAGLFIRSIAFSQITGKPLALVYGAATFDRVPELLTLSLFVVVAIAGLPASESYVINPDVFETDGPVEFSGDVLTGLVGLVATALSIRLGLLIAIFIRRDAVIGAVSGFIGRFAPKAGLRIGVLLSHFADALRFLSSWRDIVRAVAWTMAFWFCYLAAHACTLAAFDLLTSWQAPMLVLVLTAVSMAMPGAPGFIGQWHLAVVLGLVIAAPGLGDAEMKAVAIVSHLLHVALISLMGVASLVLENVKVGDLRAAAE